MSESVDFPKQMRFVLLRSRYVSLTINGEPLPVPWADCAEPGSESGPACVVGLQTLLSRTEAVVPTAYDYSSWYAECNEGASTGDGSVSGATQIQAAASAGGSSGKLLSLVVAVAAVIWLLRRARVVRALQCRATLRRLGRH